MRSRSRFNVLECGRRFGKTKLGVGLLCHAAARGRTVAWFAPTHKLLDEPWREVKRIVKDATANISEQNHKIRLTTGGAIDFWSLDNPDSGRGSKYHRVILDEAGIIRDLQEAWEQTIRPTLTDYRGDAWFLGTPKGRNYFHQLFARGGDGTPGWASWRLPTTDNPYIPADEVEAARRELPEAVFNQEYLGIPADDGGNPFDLSAIRRCVKPNGGYSTPVAFGVDLAKSHDWSVACGLDQDGNVVQLDRWQGPWGDTRARILAQVNGWPTLVDSTGVGDPIVEDLQKVRANIQGFKFTQQSKQQLMEGLASAIQMGEVSFPDSWLVRELETFEYEYTRTGVRYTAPAGLHDDGVCALALAVKAKREMARYSLRLGGAGYGNFDDDNEDD